MNNNVYVPMTSSSMLCRSAPRLPSCIQTQGMGTHFYLPTDSSGKGGETLEVRGSIPCQMFSTGAVAKQLTKLVSKVQAHLKHIGGRPLW